MQNDKLLILLKEKNFLLKKKQHILANTNNLFCVYKQEIQDIQDINKRLEQINLILNPKEIIEQELKIFEDQYKPSPVSK